MDPDSTKWCINNSIHSHGTRRVAGYEHTSRPKETQVYMCIAYSCKSKSFLFESSLSHVSEVMLCTSGLERLQDNEIHRERRKKATSTDFGVKQINK